MGMNKSPPDNQRQPLLLPVKGRAESTSPDPVWRWPIRATSAVRSFVVENPVLICTYALQFCTYFAKHMVEVPTIKLFEQAICNRYYRGQSIHLPATPDVHEGLCKIPAVQIELATLTGLKFTFDGLPALLTALYYGSIADRYAAYSHSTDLCTYLTLADSVEGSYLRSVAQELHAASYGFYSSAMLIPTCP